MKLTKNLRLNQKIGSGAYGLVYHASDTNGGSYAVKVILKLTNNRNYSHVKGGVKPSVELERLMTALFATHHGSLENEVVELSLDTIRKMGHKYHYLREMSIHLKVNQHPNVVTIHKVYSHGDFVFVVMDYYKNGDLFGAIVDKKRFLVDAVLIKKVFLQLVSAVKFCHDNKIYHCDIKPENVLISDDYQRVALTDFGLAVQQDYVADSMCCGSLYYMAPERLLGAEHQKHKYYPTSSGDIWSLGIILINFTCIRNPWMKALLKDETFEIFLSRPEILYKILPILKELFYILTHYLLVKNPYKRSSKNLDIIRKLVANCKSFTKSGPLSVCEPYRDLEQKKSCSESDLTLLHNTCYKRCYMEQDNLESPPYKRLSTNSSSLSLISSLSSISDQDFTRTYSLSSSSSVTSSPLMMNVKPRGIGKFADFEFSFDKYLDKLEPNTTKHHYHSTTSLFVYKR